MSLPSHADVVGVSSDWELGSAELLWSMLLRTRRHSVVERPVDDRLAYLRHNSGILENYDLRWQKNESVQCRKGLDTTTVSPTSARTQTSSSNDEYQWLDATSTNIRNLDADTHNSTIEYSGLYWLSLGTGIHLVSILIELRHVMAVARF